ncbi:MAG: acetylglucosamine-6-sulfatase, partial [bacterium]
QPPAWRTEFFYEHPMLTSRDFIPASEAIVRDDGIHQWKYIVWPDWIDEPRSEQLFELANDPREEHDLAADPAYAAKLEEMRATLARLRAEAK